MRPRGEPPVSRGCANRKPVSSLHVAHGRHVNCDDEGKACAFTMKDRRDCQKMTSVIIASTTCSFSYIFRLIFKIKCLTLYTKHFTCKEHFNPVKILISHSTTDQPQVQRQSRGP